MKNHLLTLILILYAFITAHAESAPPHLACESIFTDKEIRNECTEVVINTSPGSYYRGFKVNGDPTLVKLIEEKLEIDRQRSANTVEKYEGNGTYRIILNIPNNGYIINIGFTEYNDRKATLFIEAPADAFK